MQKMAISLGDLAAEWLQTEANTLDISPSELVRRAVDAYRKLQYTCSSPAHRDDVIADDVIVQVMPSAPVAPPRLITAEEQEQLATERKIRNQKHKSTE